MNFIDTAELNNARITPDGYLVADVKVARTGIQVYQGSELGIKDKAVVQVLRPEEEVFSKDSLATFSGKPVTNDHPPLMVDASNWREFAVGDIGEDVLRDGEFIRVPIKLMDAAAIKSVMDGKRELSVGYTSNIVVGDGVTDDGKKYNAVMTDIRVNHLAIVDAARAGPEARIGDGANKWGTSPVIADNAKGDDMSNALRKVIVDGLEVETTDAGHAAITKLQGELTAARGEVTKLTTDHQSVVDAKDEEIGGLKTELQTAKDTQPKPEDLDKMVADRASLVAKAKGVSADLVTDGLSDDQIRRATVAAKLGDDAVKDVSDAEVRGMFRAIQTTDPVKDHFKQAPLSVQPQQVVNDNGQSAYEQRIAGAWMGDAHKVKEA